MTFPPDDQDDRPGGPWSQQPQYPPPHRRPSHPRSPDQPGYPRYPDQPGYPQPGGSGHDPSYDGPGYPPPGDLGYPPSREYRQTAEPGFWDTEEPDYGQADRRDYRAPYGIPGVTETSAPPSTPATGSRSAAGPHSPSAFTGLVLGILGLLASFLGPILAIVFGIAGLTRIRRTGQRGGVMAVTGILLGVMWIAATAVFAVLVIHNQSYGSIAGLPAGGCFDNAQPGHVATRVRYLSSCAQPHNGEVVGTFALPGTAWPGQQAVSREASAGCAELLTSVLGQQTLSSGVRGVNYSPSQQAWSAGTRAVSCVLLDPNSTHTGSMLAGN
jgi:hypothetical protein